MNSLSEQISEEFKKYIDWYNLSVEEYAARYKKPQSIEEIAKECLGIACGGGMSSEERRLLELVYDFHHLRTDVFVRRYGTGWGTKKVCDELRNYIGSLEEGADV